MPLNITAETPRRERDILGVTVSMPEPYRAGDVLDESEASVLNQTFAENIRNNTAKRIKAEALTEREEVGEDGQVSLVESFADGWDEARVQREIIDPYVAEYRWYARGERQRLDPETRLARELCKKQIEATAAKLGRKLDRETMAAKLDEVFEKHEALFRKEAAKILKARPVVEIEL